MQSEAECFNAYSSTIFGILIVTVVFGMHYSLLQSQSVFQNIKAWIWL